MHDRTTHLKGLMKPKNLWVIVLLAVAAMVSGCGFSQPPPFDPKRIEQIQIKIGEIIDRVEGRRLIGAAEAGVARSNYAHALRKFLEK